MNLLNIILSLILAFEYANGQTIYDKLSTLNATTFLSIVNKTGMVQQLSSQGKNNSVSWKFMYFSHLLRNIFYSLNKTSRATASDSLVSHVYNYLCYTIR